MIWDATAFAFAGHSRRGDTLRVMSTDLAIALEAAHTAAALVAQKIGESFEVGFKGAVDPVTDVDHAAEALILSVLGSRRPGDGVLAEESGGVGWDEGRVWICDPIDGTVNFLHGVPHVSVSVALWEDGSPLVGVVVDPCRGETFAAVAGAGATLNGSPIRVSETTEPIRGLIVTGFPYDRHTRAGSYLRPVEAVLERFQGIRRTGSAALDLCWTASGRFDGYWEYHLKPWDAAAGALIVEEAGGLLTNLDGEPHDLGATTFVAGNPTIHQVLLETITPHLPEHLR